MLSGVERTHISVPEHKSHCRSRIRLVERFEQVSGEVLMARWLCGGIADRGAAKNQSTREYPARLREDAPDCQRKHSTLSLHRLWDRGCDTIRCALSLQSDLPYRQRYFPQLLDIVTEILAWVRTCVINISELLPDIVPSCPIKRDAPPSGTFANTNGRSLSKPDLIPERQVTPLPCKNFPGIVFPSSSI